MISSPTLGGRISAARRTLRGIGQRLTQVRRQQHIVGSTGFHRFLGPDLTKGDVSFGGTRFGYCDLEHRLGSVGCGDLIAEVGQNAGHFACSTGQVPCRSTGLGTQMPLDQTRPCGEWS